MICLLHLFVVTVMGELKKNEIDEKGDSQA